MAFKIGSNCALTKQKIVDGLVSGKLKLNHVLNSSQKYTCYFLLKPITGDLYSVNLEVDDFIPLSSEFVRYISLIKSGKLKYLDGEFLSIN